MKTLTQVALLAAVVCLLSAPGYAAGQNRLGMPHNAFPPMVLPVAGPAVTPAISSTPAPATTSAPTANPAPPANIMRLTERMGAIFTKARAAFVGTDLKLAALEIRRGAAVLRKERSKATGEVRKELAATALDLDLLAARIEQSKVQAGSELETAFARADRAIAEHGRVMAKGSDTGPAAPAKNLETTTPRPNISATAARQAMPLPSRESVSAAYAAPDKPVKGAGVSYEELSRRIETLSKEITDLRNELNTLKSRECGAK